MKSFALIGCGKIGGVHAVALTGIGKLVAVCDVIPSKADAFATRFQAIPFYTIDDLLKSDEKDEAIDYIVVCTPNGHHAEAIIKSLQARKHVITESPLCITKAAAWQILETEKFCRRKLFIVQPVMHSSIQQIKKTLATNNAGNIISFNLSCTINMSTAYYADWQYQLFPNGGSLYTPFSECIEIMFYLFGEIETIKGLSIKPCIDRRLSFEEGGSLSLQMKASMEGSFEWSLQGNTSTTLTVVGEKNTKIFTGDDVASLVPIESFDATIKRTDDSHAMYQNMYKHWLALMEKQEKDDSLQQAVAVIETIENIYKALTTQAIHSTP